MITKVQRWGNSQGLRIAKTILEEAQIRIGDQVHITVGDGDGQIIIRATHRVRGKYQLKNLVSEIQETYRIEELDWNTPTGKEAW